MAAGDRSPPAAKSSEEGPAPVSPGAARAVGKRQERYGALAVARYVKDDGRALLLYEHTPERP